MSRHKKINEKFFQIKGLQFLVKKQTIVTNKSPCSFFNQNHCLSVFSIQCCRIDQGCKMFKIEREQVKQQQTILKLSPPLISASEREQNHNINHLALS